MKPPIRPVIAHYGGDDLPEAINWRQCKCPFHDDRNASASYIAHEEHQAFKCHGCGVQGDAISLIKISESCEYREALKVLEHITGQAYGTGAPPPPKKYKPVRIGDAGTPTAVAAPKKRGKTLRLREV